MSGEVDVGSEGEGTGEDLLIGIVDLGLDGRDVRATGPLKVVDAGLDPVERLGRLDEGQGRAWGGGGLGSLGGRGRDGS